MKKILISFILLVGITLTNTSCQDYLNIVPEGVASIETAFSNRTNTEKFFTACYSYMPNFNHPNSSLGFLAADEFWLYPKGTGSLSSRIGLSCWEIGRGYQNSNDPHMNYWDASNGIEGKYGLWKGIRDCNIFLENIHKPMDIESVERARWTSEVKFLKAYYHFFLMQLYGPIMIMDKNIEVSASVEEVRKYRDPFDDVVTYIVGLLDESVDGLPSVISFERTELGRITKSVALSVKAQVLLFAASPLMNGNEDYVQIMDDRGVHLFPQEYDATKWKKAADAALVAINEAETNGAHRLFNNVDLSIAMEPITRTLLSISGAVNDSWNSEIIWGESRVAYGIQSLSMPKLEGRRNNWINGLLAPTLTIAEQFYSVNGVPLNEDNGEFWRENYNKRHDIVNIPDEGYNKYILNVEENEEDVQQTVNLHLNREPRFYANLFFDRGTFFNNTLATTPQESFIMRFRLGESSGRASDEDHSITGYLPKKLINFESEVGLTANDSWDVEGYAFPIIRLADLYLMYAEALNETLSAPNDSVYMFLDEIRERADLKGVVESWATHSTKPTKPLTKDGMREIIRMERLNELALEGKRFWDLRRWKIPLPSEVKGWNIMGSNAEEFYRVTTLYTRQAFHSREYLWPIKIEAIQKNPNILQNPGWN